MILVGVIAFSESTSAAAERASCQESFRAASIDCSGARVLAKPLLKPPPKPALPAPPPKQVRKAPKVHGFRVLRAAVDPRGGVCLYQRWVPMPAGTGVAHDPWHLSLLGISAGLSACPAPPAAVAAVLEAFV
ncbi:MAG: hypothetical protein ACT4OS_09225, partial [Acidimicrobiales bacterium]